MYPLNNESLAVALKKAGVLDDVRVAAAFEAVPRHLFLLNVPLEVVYQDKPIYTRTDDKGAFLGGIDQPSQVAQMLTFADLQAGHNVLEIGTGTGYNAALMQHLVGQDGLVTSLEIDHETSETAQDNLRRAHMSRVKVVHVDGAGGYAPRASYDRIVSTVALWDVPSAWVKQLRPDGMIIAPMYLDGLQVIVALRVQKDGSLLSVRQVSCSFVPMLGVEAAPPQVVYMGGGSALRIYSTRATELDTAKLHALMSTDAERCHLGVAPTHDAYWNGFVPYMMLQEPNDYDFVCYTVEGEKIVYGLSGQGFGVVTVGSATFVNTRKLGDTHCFAGVDAFLFIDQHFKRWEQRGKPMLDKMRVQLVPNTSEPTLGGSIGRVYPRYQHHLAVWFVSSDGEQ